MVLNSPKNADNYYMYLLYLYIMAHLVKVNGFPLQYVSSKPNTYNKMKTFVYNHDLYSRSLGKELWCAFQSVIRSGSQTDGEDRDDDYRPYRACYWLDFISTHIIAMLSSKEKTMQKSQSLLWGANTETLDEDKTIQQLWEIRWSSFCLEENVKIRPLVEPYDALE